MTPWRVSDHLYLFLGNVLTVGAVFTNNSYKSAFQIVHDYFSVAVRFDALEVAAVHPALNSLVHSAVDLSEISTGPRDDENN